MINESATYLLLIIACSIVAAPAVMIILRVMIDILLAEFWDD